MDTPLKNIILLISAFFASAATSQVVSTASANIKARQLPGINVSGCEFSNDSSLCPTEDIIDAYADMGFRAIRLPVKSAQLNTAVLKLLPAVNEALKRGMLVVVDLHDFLPLDPARIVPLIKRVAASFGPEIYIDYDNEPRPPSGATGDKWLASAAATNEIIAGARLAHVSNPLVVEWPGYSGNYRAFPIPKTSTPICTSFGCALDRIGGLKDPLGKTVLGPHRYYDQDKSGSTTSCSPTVFYWDRYFEDAEARGYKSLIGETAFGGAARGVSASCRAAAEEIMRQISASSGTLAFMAWGGGASWRQGYLFSIPPTPSTASSDYVKQLVGGRR